MSGEFVLANVLGVLVGALVSAVPAVRSILKAREERKFAADSQLERILDSDDLDAIGAHLRDKLGSVSIQSYTFDLNLRDELDRCVARVADLVNSDDASEDERELAAPPERPVVPPAASSHPKVRLAYDMWANGQTWNALASLRRDLENELQAVSLSPDRRAFSSLADGLGRDAQSAWSNFLRTANAAIHGREVPDASVLDALKSAQIIYDALLARRSAPTAD